jgi:hypothetical protein
VISALKGARLLSFISPSSSPPDQFMPLKEGKGDDKEPPVVNPDYETWVAKDG